MIGDHVYEVTFIADTDGLPLEFIRRLTPKSAIKVSITEMEGQCWQKLPSYTSLLQMIYIKT